MEQRGRVLCSQSALHSHDALDSHVALERFPSPLQEEGLASFKAGIMYSRLCPSSVATPGRRAYRNEDGKVAHMNRIREG